MKGKGGGGVFEGEESLGDDGKSAIGFVGGKTRRWGWGSGGGRREAVAAGFGLRLGRSGWVGVGSGRVRVRCFWRLLSSRPRSVRKLRVGCLLVPRVNI